MKKFSSSIFAITLLLLSIVSCKKDSDDSPKKSDDFSDVFWKVDDTEYRLQANTKVFRTTSDFKDIAAAGINSKGVYCSYSISFKEYPTKSQRMNVTTLYSEFIESNECIIAVVPGDSFDGIISVGEEGDYVDITVKDGKISAEFSNIRSMGLLSSKEYKISGYIHE